MIENNITLTTCISKCVVGWVGYAQKMVQWIIPYVRQKLLLARGGVDISMFLKRISPPKKFNSYSSDLAKVGGTYFSLYTLPIVFCMAPHRPIKDNNFQKGGKW